MLVALWDVSNQFNDNNGSILTNGKVYVYYSGRAALAPTWSSADGSHVNSNPIILDNNGRAVAFADDQYTYTCVVCDFYGRELFSFDPASFGTGGGGSTTEGNDAAHWIGATGTDVQVTALADTLLPLPSNPDYEGDFVSQTTYTTISLNKGLYMVDADIRIQQDDDDLENIIKDISVYTGLTGPDSLITSQKNWTGPEASDDRHYIHVHFIRHVADEGEDIYFQMNSPVDLSSAWIDKLSIVKLTEGGNGKSYVGGYGIDITGPVISVSGMMPEASAANFVDVSTYNSDIENIYDTIAETSAMIPSGVATEQFVEDFTSAFITEDALNGYATQEWVQDQHYITSADIPPIPEDVVTSAELATVSGEIVNQIPDVSDMATQTWVNEQGFLTSIPDDLVTSGELASTSADLESMIPSLDGYATEQFVEDYTSAFITESDIPADLVTSGELATVSGQIMNDIPDVSDMATQTWVGQQGYLTSVPDEYVTSGELATVSGDIMSQIPSPTTVSIDPTLSSGTKIAEFNINGTSGELYAPEGGGSGATYTATSPIAIDGSNNISLNYGNTLVVNNTSNTDTAESNQYGNMTLAILSDPSESDNLQISTSSNIRVNGTAGNHLRLRIDLDDTDNYIDSKVNLQSEGQEITLTGTSWTIQGFQTPSGSTWASVFDFSVHPISDMYASQATYGEVTVELWEYNGDTPVKPLYGAAGMYWPEGITIDFDSSSSSLNVANPMPDPGYVSNYVLTSNGYGGSYWAPAQGGSSYNGVYPIQVSTNTISLAHDSTLSDKQSSVISAKGEENGYGGLEFMPYAGVPSDSSPCKIQGSATVKVTGTSDNTVRLRLFSGSYPYMDMITDLVDEYGEPIYLSGYPDDEIQIQTNDSTWASLFDFSEVTIEDLWDAYPSIQLWEYNGDTPVRALITDSWPSGFNIDFGSTSTTFGVTDPLPASTSSDNSKVLTVVNGSPAWANAPGGSSYTAGDNISIVNDEISVSGTAGLVAGDNISITASGDNYVISSTGGGGSGSDVDIIPTLSSGTKIADYVIDGTSGSLYAPSGSSGGSDVFWAVYDEYDSSACTPIQDIIDAYQAGKTVLLKIVEDVGVGYRYEVGQLSWISIANTEGWESSDFAIFTVNKEPGMENNDYVANTQCEYIKVSRSDGWIKSRSVMIQDPSQATVGSVLTLTSNGSWPEAEWAAPAGGGGLDQVYHDASLTGSGTSASPLSITSASNWTEAYNAINDSASYWNDAAGMNEYPISAGPGMSIEDVDGVTVFQTSGTMMDDLIEYNSQNEISGYNGHPVMTVDSEKQWLTHDDTIAHVTNSAQYAFGVNVPVVAQAMGTDETVLFEGGSANTKTATLSESITNFNYLWVRVDDDHHNGRWVFVDTDEPWSKWLGNYGYDDWNTTSTILGIREIGFKASGTTVTSLSGLQKNVALSGTAWTSAYQTGQYGGIVKVIGIGRKEN
jgi:hypothetical protein